MRLSALLMLLTFTACDHNMRIPFFSKTPQLDTVVDFNSVDEPPLFYDCKSLESLESADQCFQKHLAERIGQALRNDLSKITLTELLNNEIKLKVAIDKYGGSSLDSIQASHLSTERYTEIFDVVNAKLKGVKLLRGATKKGIPVKVLYEVPIYFQSQETDVSGY